MPSEVEKERQTPKKRSPRRPRVSVVVIKGVLSFWKKCEGKYQCEKPKKAFIERKK